jgi:outer membrane protein
MRPYTPVLVAISLTVNVATANDLLSLYQLALTRDPQLQTANFQHDAAMAQRAQARSQLLPKLAANASAQRDRAGFDVNSPAAPPTTLCPAHGATERCYGNLHGVGVSLTQTLWNFESLSRLRESSSQAESSAASLLGAQQNLMLRAARVYFGVLGARDQLATNRSARATFGVLLNQAKDRLQTGVGPRSDVEQAQAFYDATEQSVIDAENALDDAKLALSELVGAYDHEIGEIAPLREEIPMTVPEPASPDAWVAIAWGNNPDLRAAQLQVDAADHDIAASAGKGLPTVALTASSSHLWQDQTLGGNETLDTVGISLSWPLFQGGAVAASMRQSRALYRQAQAQFEATRRETERQTRAAYRGVVSGVQRIAAARRAVESGRIAVEATRRNVEFATGTEFDLLNAQNNYYAALRAYNQSRYDYVTSLLTLRQQAGRLSENDLVEVDELLVARVN